MGDRANVVVDVDGQAPIYLYTHWSGSELPAILQSALARGVRWNDEAYLTRVIFCEMIKGSERDETGFGISTSAPDNSYAYLRVSPDHQTVTVDYAPVHQYHKGPNVVYSFREYIDLPDISWETFEKGESVTA